MSENRKILKATGLLSVLTLISRFTGLARDMVLAAMLGGSRISDVFYIAFELSNLARRVLGEGALSSFVVPIFEERKKISADAGWRFVNRAINAVGLLTLVLTLIGMIFSGPVFDFFGGFGLKASASVAATSAERDEILGAANLGIDLTRLMFPNLVALAIGSIMMGVCNALNSFAAPALGSVVLNIAMILAGAAALMLHADPATGTIWLGWSVLAGAVLRVLLMVPAMMRAGWRYSAQLRARTEDDGLRILFSMMGAGLFGMSINQINMSVVSIFAAYLGPGNKTFLVYANRLIQFPMALTATAMATAMLPQLARMTLDGRHAELRNVMGFTKRIELVLMMPAALGLMFFGMPICELLFQRGEFTAADTRGTFEALLFYAPGLFAYGWTRLVQPLFYARKDVRTPVIAAVISMIFNVALAAAFTFWTPLAQRGLALANTLAAFLNYAILYYYLNRDPAQPLSGARTTETLIKTFAAGLISIGGVWFIHTEFIAPLVEELGAIAHIAVLGAIMIISAWGYFMLARLFRVPDAERATEKIMNRLRRKKSSPPAPPS